MTDIIATTQKQDVDSGILYLFDLEISDGVFERFYDGDRPITFDGNTYQPIPIEMEGIELTSDGAYQRPVLRVSNINNFLYNELEAAGGLESLIGRRITKRTTFEKYLASSPAVEYPKVSFVIDRVLSRNIISIEFELAAPFDLANITLPRRRVLNGSCPWIYKGHPNGGCNWDKEFHNPGGSVYVDIKNNYMVNANRLNSEAVSLPTGAKSAYTLYTTQGASGIPNEVIYQTLVNSDGSYTENVVVDRYWFCTKNAAASEKPWSTPSKFIEYRPFLGYSPGTTYRAFTNSIYSDIALYGGDVWKPRAITLDANNHDIPSLNRFWKHADACSKTLDGCSRRFNYGPNPDGLPTERRSNTMPFGGFPGASRNAR